MYQTNLINIETCYTMAVAMATALFAADGVASLGFKKQWHAQRAPLRAPRARRVRFSKTNSLPHFRVVVRTT